MRLTRERRLVAGFLLVTTTVATVCERARVLDLGDCTHHADKEKAVRGLGVESGFSGRDNPHTSGRQLVEQEFSFKIEQAANQTTPATQASAKKPDLDKPIQAQRNPRG